MSNEFNGFGLLLPVLQNSVTYSFVIVFSFVPQVLPIQLKINKRTNSDQLDFVDHFKYLGHAIANNLTDNLDIQKKT